MVKQNTTENHVSVPPDNMEMSWRQWLWAEIKFHLFPWGEGFLTQKAAIVATSLGLAMAVTVVWMLALTGRAEPTVTIAWWTGWSVYECICRMGCKPWVKEGPWWGGWYREASLADMIAYVATKNLLIGIGLFWMLYFLRLVPGAFN